MLCIWDELVALIYLYIFNLDACVYEYEITFTLDLHPRVLHAILYIQTQNITYKNCSYNTKRREIRRYLLIVGISWFSRPPSRL